MKQILLKSISALLVVVAIASCQKDEIATPVKNQPAITQRIVCGEVDYSAPTTVLAGEEFTISAVIGCGRVALDQGFIEVDGENVYADLACDTEELEFEQLVGFQCFTTDLSYTTTIDEPGIYVFRTRHNVNDGNCDGIDPPGPGDPGDCASMGTTHCCFVIEVLAACEILPGDYFTYSQGFYLNSPNGEEFLGDHPELGPVTVGCEDGTTTTYTLADIIAMDPGNSSAPGILVKQIITMTLNVSASDFLGSGEDLGCLVVVADEDPLTTLDDLFEGMTVDEIIAAANDYVGGCDTTTFTAGDLTAILAAIVDNFHEGEDNLGLLTCCEN